MIPMEYALLFTGVAVFLGTTMAAAHKTEGPGRTVFFYRSDTGACSGWALLVNGRIEHRVYDRRIETLLNKGIIVPVNNSMLLSHSPEQATKGSARILVPGSMEHFTAAISEVRSLGYYAVVTTAAVEL